MSNVQQEKSRSCPRLFILFFYCHQHCSRRHCCASGRNVPFGGGGFQSIERRFCRTGGDGGSNMARRRRFGCRAEARLARMCCGTMSTFGRAFFFFILFSRKKIPVVFALLSAHQNWALYRLFIWFVLMGRGWKRDRHIYDDRTTRKDAAWHGAGRSSLPQAVPTELACRVAVAEKAASFPPLIFRTPSGFTSPSIADIQPTANGSRQWIRPRNRRQHSSVTC